MSDDLVEFLRARLAEDAELAARSGPDECGEWLAHGHTVDFCQSELAGFHPTVARHVAAHDPARVLRDVDAKRRVLARHALSPAVGDPELPWDNRDDCQWDGEDWPCPDLLDLALPYSDHPDYRGQWRPHPKAGIRRRAVRRGGGRRRAVRRERGRG
ncbi:DUF6221 family protein [Streptomyces sp. NPDC057137]|uniref:DUF6221 family protein n=1 Tax=Streptomyces sp. NPDC057137 TaxID=3346030 RepID=UPI003624B903